MSPDDKRHGTTAGYQAHRRAGVPTCQPCLRAKTRYEKVRNVYGEQMVPAIGTRRRIRALKALGFSGAELGSHLGITYQAVHKLEVSPADKVFAPTAKTVADLYSKLSQTTPIGPHRTRIRNKAAEHGYALPRQWYDIDDPNEEPDPGYRQTSRSHHEVDVILVERILSGDSALGRVATKSEKVEVVARWKNAGRSLNELARLTGWEPNRYITKRAA